MNTRTLEKLYRRADALALLWSLGTAFTMAVLDLLPDKILTTDLQYYLQKHRNSTQCGFFGCHDFPLYPFSLWLPLLLLQMFFKTQCDRLLLIIQASVWSIDYFSGVSSQYRSWPRWIVFCGREVGLLYVIRLRYWIHWMAYWKVYTGKSEWLMLRIRRVSSVQKRPCGGLKISIYAACDSMISSNSSGHCSALF